MRKIYILCIILCLTACSLLHENKHNTKARVDMNILLTAPKEMPNPLVCIRVTQEPEFALLDLDGHVYKEENLVRLFNIDINTYSDGILYINYVTGVST